MKKNQDIEQLLHIGMAEIHNCEHQPVQSFKPHLKPDPDRTPPKTKER